MMAPDSQRVTPVLGSSMAGTRPLGLMDSKGSFLRSPKSVSRIRKPKYETNGWENTHELSGVGKLELFKDKGNLPRVGPGS